MVEEHFLSLNIRIGDVLEIIVGDDKYLGYFIEMSQPHCVQCVSTVIISPILTKGARLYQVPSEDAEVWLELSDIDKITVFGRVTTAMESIHDEPCEMYCVCSKCFGDEN